LIQRCRRDYLRRIVIDGLKIAENQRFEIAAPAAPARRSLGGEQLLDGMPRQGLQPPEAGAQRPTFTGLAVQPNFATGVGGGQAAGEVRTPCRSAISNRWF
jgi:hypothetical protein